MSQPLYNHMVGSRGASVPSKLLDASGNPYNFKSATIENPDSSHIIRPQAAYVLPKKYRGKRDTHLYGTSTPSAMVTVEVDVKVGDFLDVFARGLVGLNADDSTSVSITYQEQGASGETDLDVETDTRVAGTVEDRVIIMDTDYIATVEGNLTIRLKFQSNSALNSLSSAAVRVLKFFAPVIPS